ncbi:MAG: 50S ribosomal protein L25 [PVC group bacterium]
MAQLEITVQTRSEVGGRRPRRLRRLGLVPAVLYGGDEDALSLALDLAGVQKKAGPLHENQIISLVIDRDGGKQATPAIVKEIQMDHLAGVVLHIDFQQIALDVKLTATVPVVAVGEAVGVIRDGGILEHILREVEIRCLPGDLPDKIAVDVSALAIGDTLYVRDIPIAERIEILTDSGISICTVAAPAIEEEEKAPEEAAAGAEAAEGEAESKPEAGTEEEAGKED